MGDTGFPARDLEHTHGLESPCPLALKARMNPLLPVFLFAALVSSSLAAPVWSAHEIEGDPLFFIQAENEPTAKMRSVRRPIARRVSGRMVIGVSSFGSCQYIAAITRT